MVDVLVTLTFLLYIEIRLVSYCKDDFSLLYVYTASLMIILSAATASLK